MHLVKKLFFLLLLSALTLAHAQPDQVRQALSRALPGMSPDSIAESVVPGVYEVTFGPQVVYVSSDGRYLIQGAIMELGSQRNLTAERRSQLLLAELRELGEDNMILFPAPKQKHVITVFTDIDCGYCRKLHAEVPELNRRGITVRYLFFPRSGPDTPSYHKARSVWCAKDRRAALTAAKQGKDPEPAQCDNPVDRHLRLVQELGLRGTPAIVLENGRIIPGYVPAARLEQMLDQTAAAPQ
ncbi:DsbC family protein [Thiohalobacter sp.]|uniref:DsbC family protein n=1 Tax=Thiohalobacter sp. TaxID=2025948 RepID=UPI0026221D23|nr:DsbC family protein [Thiohalobacter sp.]